MAAAPFWNSVAFLADLEGILQVHFVLQAHVPDGAHLRVACGKEGKVSPRLQPGREKAFCRDCGEAMTRGAKA